jgi:8-oxo-dGTP diphosphatase
MNIDRLNNVIFGQKAFIYKDGKVLIIKRKNVEIFSGIWDVPGGKVKSNDNNLLKSLSREIREEVGLKLTKIIFILSTSKFEGSSEDHPIIFRNIYLCLAKGNIKLSNEHSEFLWVKPEDLKEYIFPDTQDFQRVLKRMPSIIKSVDGIANYSEIF